MGSRDLVELGVAVHGAAARLLSTGDLDQVVPSVYARLVAGLLPDSRMRTWSDGGHMLVLDRAGQVAPAVEEVLSG